VKRLPHAVGWCTRGRHEASVLWRVRLRYRDIEGSTSPIAPVGDACNSQEFADLPAGTLFVGATDGVTEARNADGELFGMERFVAAAVTHRALPEAEFVHTLMEEVRAFCLGNRRDDIAIAAVRFL
jgi:sigma-B regulation protein RsbU (phosphoserine phosphatase)